MKFSKLTIGAKFELWSGKYTKTGDFEYTSTSGDVKSIDLAVKTPYYAVGQVWVSESGGEAVILAVGEEYIGYGVDGVSYILDIASFYSNYATRKADSLYEGDTV